MCPSRPWNYKRSQTLQKQAMEIRQHGVFKAVIVKVKIMCEDNMTAFWSYMYDASYTDVLPIQHHWNLEMKITRIQKGILTFDFHAHCAINGGAYSIVSCTSVCSICTSLDITQDIFSIYNWKQRCTICTIIFYFRPSDGWCWSTSCIANQSHQGALTNHSIITYIGNSRGHCKNSF